MPKLNYMLCIACMAILTVCSGVSWGQCTSSDGNNDAAHAQPIGVHETVSDWVCPDDPFDYYIAEIPAGAEISGRIIFHSPQVSTVLRIEHEATGTRVVPDWSTNDERDEFMIPIPAGAVPAGTYIIRVSFWSEAEYDHEYTLTLDLTVTGGPDCIADGNEERESASEIAFDTTVNDWVCDADHIDVWHFAVTNELKSRGLIYLRADPGELILYLYDSDANELFQGRTDDGELECDLVMDERGLLHGDYYIGVFLPLARDDENSYSISLQKGLPIVFPMVDGTVGALGERPDIPRAPRVPWPSNGGNHYNSSLSTYSGPPGDIINTLIFDRYELSREDMEENKRQFTGLLVGTGNIVVMFAGPDRTIYAVDISTGETIWEATTRGWQPPCLGPNGEVYYIESGTADLVAADLSTGRRLWSQDIDTGPTMEIENVGKYIYMAVEHAGLSTEPHTYINAYDLEDGELVMSCGPFYGRVTGIADDIGGNFYVECRDKLCKFFSNGGMAWFVELPDDTGLNLIDYYGPIVGPRGKVWVYYDKMTQFRVYNTDGSIYKSGDYGYRPRAICMDADGRTYVADENRIVCYDDYDEYVWSVMIGFPYIDDMAMGADGNIYFTSIAKFELTGGGYAFVSQMVCIDSYDGHSFATAPLHIDRDVIEYIHEKKDHPYYNRQYAKVAIGEGQKVIALHHSGLLEVFSPVLVQVYAIHLEGLGDY